MHEGWRVVWDAFGLISARTSSGVSVIYPISQWNQGTAAGSLISNIRDD